MKKAKQLTIVAATLALTLAFTACGAPPTVVSTPQDKTPASTPASTAASTAADPKLAEHTIEAIKAKGTITFATESQYAPMCFKNEKGEMIGLEPKIMQAIADDLGVKLEIQDMAFDSVIPSVQAGAVDIGMAGLTPQPTRLETVDMTEFYNHGGQAMIVLTKNLEKYAEKASLKGVSIAAQKGSLQQTIGEEQFADSKLSLFPKVPQCVEELKADNVAAVLMDDVSAAQYAKSNPGVVSVCKVPVPIDEAEQGTSAAVMKGNSDLNNYLNGMIKKLWDSGDLDAWFLQYKEEASKLGLDG